MAFFADNHTIPPRHYRAAYQHVLCKGARQRSRSRSLRSVMERTKAVCTSHGREFRFSELSWASSSDDSDTESPRKKRAQASRASAADDRSLTRKRGGKVREFVLQPAYDLLPCHTITTVAARDAKRRARLAEKAPRRFRFIDVPPDTSDESDSSESDADDKPSVARETPDEDTGSESFRTCRDDRDDEAPRLTRRHRLQAPHDGLETSPATTRRQDDADSEAAELRLQPPHDGQEASPAGSASTNKNEIADSDSEASEAAELRSACTWLTPADYGVLTSPEGWLNDIIVNAYAELINIRNSTYFEKQGRDSASDAACDPPATGIGQDSNPVLHPRGVRPRKRTPVRTRSTRATNASDDASVMVEGGRRKTFVFGSFFYERLTSEGRYQFSNVQRWTKCKSWSLSTPAKPVLEYGKVLVPIHVHEAHWVLAAIDITYRRFVYMDSLQAGDTCGVIPTLRRWLIDELTDKYTADVVRLQEVPSWEVVINPPYVGTQTDAASCGMFMLALAERLELGKVPVITQGDIPSLREQASRCLRERKLPKQ